MFVLDKKLKKHNIFMKNFLNILLSAIFAGVCIGIAGFGYLTNPVIGMFLFIFGLSAVVNYQVKLFTGTAGFLKKSKDIWMLLVCLIGNIIGCYLVSRIAVCSPNDLVLAAEILLSKRLALGWFKSGVMAIGCGILMSASVQFARKSKEIGNWVPLLLAVPLFILCGFPHCIADAFYYLTCSSGFLYEHFWSVLKLYGSIVVGNFIGCNVYHIIRLF